MPGSMRPVRRRQIPGSRLPIAGDRPDTTADILGDPPNGIYDGERIVPARQRGAFKRFPGTDELTPATRGQPERLQPIRFDFGNLPREIGQRPPPNSPYGFNAQKIAGPVPVVQPLAPQLRRLQTLPQAMQLQIVEGIDFLKPQEAGPEIDRRIDQGLYLINTPGDPTREDLAAAIKLPEQTLLGVQFTQSTLNEARDELTEEAPPGAVEIPDEQLLDRALDVAQRHAFTSGVFFPTFAPPLYAPSEQAPEPLPQEE